MPAMRSSLWHRRASQRVSQDPDIPRNSMRNPAVIIAAHYDSASTLRTRKTRDDFLTIGR